MTAKNRIKKVTNRNRLYILRTPHQRSVSLIIEALVQQVVKLSEKKK